MTVKWYKIFAITFPLIYCFIFAYTIDNISTTTLKSTKGIKQKSRTLVPLLLLNSTNYAKRNHTISHQGRYNCKWLKNYKYQRNQCKKRKGLLMLLQKTRQLVIASCSYQFRNYRWNCTIGQNTFAKISIETAYLQSLTSAALMYTLSQGCTDGKLEECTCSKERQPKNKMKWQWSGCGDNIKDGKLLTSKFLKLNDKVKDNEDKIYKINAKIGLRSVAENTIKSCICHGLSGSCTLKICVRRIKQFDIIANDLKDKYHNAIRLTSNDGIMKQLDRYKKSSNLLYLEENSSYCELTVGGRCINLDHCATYCCGRGFTKIKNQTKTRCKFRVSNITVKYELCYEDAFICK